MAQQLERDEEKQDISSHFSPKHSTKALPAFLSHRAQSSTLINSHQLSSTLINQLATTRRGGEFEDSSAP